MFNRHAAQEHLPSLLWLPLGFVQAAHSGQAAQVQVFDCTGPYTGVSTVQMRHVVRPCGNIAKVIGEAVHLWSTSGSSLSGRWALL